MLALKTNLIAHISEHAAGFSKGQKRIAQYIQEHYESAAFMTAFKLGETVGVSESTVVRFAAELGFDGYPQLQKAMQELIRSKLTTVQRIEVTRARMADDEVLDNVMAYDMANIRQTLEELPRDVFYQAVDAIVEARRVSGAGQFSRLLFKAAAAGYPFDLHLERNGNSGGNAADRGAGRHHRLELSPLFQQGGKDRPLRTFPAGEDHCDYRQRAVPYSGVRVLSAVGAQRYGHHRGFLGRAAEYYQRIAGGRVAEKDGQQRRPADGTRTAVGDLSGFSAV